MPCLQFIQEKGFAAQLSRGNALAAKPTALHVENPVAASDNLPVDIYTEQQEDLLALEVRRGC